MAVDLQGHKKPSIIILRRCQVNLLILSFSLVVSVITSFLIGKRKNSKLLGTVTALVMNTLILGTAFSILYYRDDEARTFGIGTDHDVLILAIPIVIWINFVLIQFVRDKQ